jgi:hypothetical protein
MESTTGRAGGYAVPLVIQDKLEKKSLVDIRQPKGGSRGDPCREFHIMQTRISHRLLLRLSSSALERSYAAPWNVATST